MANGKRLGRPPHIDLDAVRRLWPDPKWTTEQIADHLGVSVTGVKRAAKGMGLGKRPYVSRAKRADPRDQKAKAEPCLPASVPEHRHFSPSHPERDARLFACGNSWREFDRLAQNWNISPTIVLQRWSVLRREG